MAAAPARHQADTGEVRSRYQSFLFESSLLALSRDAGSAARHAARVLTQIEDSLRHGSLALALREADRAWRTLPEKHGEVLAPIYARLLALEDRDPGAALRMLQRAKATEPDLAALTIHALLQLRRSHEAIEQLESALSAFCLTPSGLLAQVASEVLRALNEAPGWTALGPNLELLVATRDGDPRDVMVTLDGTGVELEPVDSSDCGPEMARFKLPHLTPGSTVRVTRDGVPLLGSGLHIPSDFGLDGRANCIGGLITGWARIGWLPTRPMELCLEDDGGQRRPIKTRAMPRWDLRWPFTANLRQLRIRGHRVQISALLADGRWQALPDSPLLLEPAIRLSANRPAPLKGWRAAALLRSAGTRTPKRVAAIDVIIPVYRGAEESLACIESVLATAGNARVVVVDDGSEEAALSAALDALEASGRIRLLRNPANVGFVGSVNRALGRNRTHDVVILNSDTLVFGDWLERLQLAAYRSPRVGTVTPFSNSGTVASYPGDEERPMSTEEAATLHQLAAATNSHLSSEIPVGVGFCLYIRRDCLREVGHLDASVFGKGYGEETDFCLRARQLGWSHHLAADVFVYHAGGRSFGTRRAALLDRARRLINVRYPGYDRFIADFIARDPINPLRRRMDERRLTAHPDPFVLLVTPALSGGVQRFISERMSDIRTRGFTPLVLRPHKPGDAKRCELWTDAIDVPSLRYAIPSDLGALEKMLRVLRIHEVELQHFLSIDARVIDLVRARAPYDIFVHDYAWICPRVTLVNGRGHYCGEPAVSACEVCVKRNGSNLGGAAIGVSALRERSASWLSQARRVITPSADAASRLKKYFPVDFDVRPNAAPNAPADLPPRAAISKVVRVAVIGAIGEHKGYSVLLSCARAANMCSLPLEFIVIGYTQDDQPLLDTGKVFITGRYSEGEAAHLLRRERPDVAFLPSVSPETWCYALDEAIAVGLPVVAFDLGAIAERLRSLNQGILLPLDEKPKRINDLLLKFAAESAIPDRVDAVPAQELVESNDMTNMTANGVPMMNEPLAASVQVLPLPPGLYLFSVQAAGTSTEHAENQLRLPAMHVGLGPGVHSDQVEFIAGPSTEGAWLFAQEDLLVTKIGGTGATLVLTSVRASGGEALSIKVERLESRANSTATALPLAAKEMASPATQELAEPEDRPKAESALPVRINAHIRARGDMSFSDTPWAGRVAPGLWIESFSIKPPEGFDGKDIEYKGLTGSGFETPWLTEDKMCGTKGMSVPLVGFAVRLKPGPRTAEYDCEYSGFFKSGTTVGPLRNGAPCRSSVASDPIEGIQVRICKRATPAKTPSLERPAAAAHAATNGKGPSFGRYRNVNGHSAAINGSTHTDAVAEPDKSASGAARRSSKAKPAAKGPSPASPRPSARRS